MSCHVAQALDLCGYEDSPLHRLDARAKLLFVLVFVMCVASFPKYEVTGLIPFFAFPLLLGVVGCVPFRLIARMLIYTAPFAVLVGLFNPFLDAAPAFFLGSVPIRAGWFSFASILLRFILSLGMVLVMVASTSLPGLLHGLLQLGAPRPFVIQLQFLYRYLFLLAEEGSRLSHARQLRNPSRRHASLAMAPKLISALLWRAWDRAERIFLCMKTRGFQGDFPHFQPRRFSGTDAGFLAGMTALCLFLRFMPMASFLGQWALRAGSPL